MTGKKILSKAEINTLKEAVKAVEDGGREINTELRKLLSDLSEGQAIVRTIELPVIYQQAGLSLLNFISRVLVHRHPDVDATVRVEQQQGVIRVIVDVPENIREAVEETLEQYSMVLRRKLSLDRFLSSKDAMMELKQKLDISALEVNISEGLLVEEKLAEPRDFAEIEQKIITLHDNVGEGLSSVYHLRKIIDELLEKHNALIAEPLATLKSKLETSLTKEDEQAVKKALSEMQENEPDAFDQIQDVINKGSVSGKAGDYLYGWLSAITNALPH